MPGDTIEISKVSEKYKENYDAIDWSALRNRPIDKEKAKATKRHVTCGLCGEYGTSEFNKEEFDKNFDRIDWNNDKNS